MDKIDKATRSRVMSKVKSKNTKPEMKVRSLAHKAGYRYRLHSSSLPGKPDMVFPSRKLAIFIHGCFWHGHNCKHGKRQPSSNTEYWSNKIRGNVERDKRVQNELVELGWKPLIIWECQIEAEDFPQQLIRILK